MQIQTIWMTYADDYKTEYIILLHKLPTRFEYL
jgi:hypothetical protein